LAKNLDENLFEAGSDDEEKNIQNRKENFTLFIK